MLTLVVFSIAYNGLGDVFIVLFFGFGAIEYRIVLSSAVILDPQWFVSFGMGLIINNLLMVNNYRISAIKKRTKKQQSLFSERFWIGTLFFPSCASIIFPIFTEVSLLCMTAFFLECTDFQAFSSSNRKTFRSV